MHSWIIELPVEKGEMRKEEQVKTYSAALGGNGGERSKWLRGEVRGLEMEWVFEEKNKRGAGVIQDMLFQGQRKLWGVCGHLSIQRCPIGFDSV